MKIPAYLLTLINALLLSLGSTLCSAAEAPTVKEIAEKEEFVKLEEAAKSVKPKGPYDEYGRTTPRSSVIGLAKALKSKDFETAAKYMDLRNLPFTVHEADGPELARKLLIVAIRSMVVDYESLSDDPEGHRDDSLPSYRDRITTVKTSEGIVDILMQRVPRSDGVFIWKLSNATVAKIPELDKELGYGVIGDRLSLIFPEYQLLGFEAWQWAMILVLLVASYLIGYIVTWLLYKLLSATRGQGREKMRRFVKGPLHFLIMVLFFRATFYTIAPSLEAQALFQARTLLIVAVVWVLMGFVDMLLYKIAARMKKQGHDDAIVLLRPASTAIKIIIVFIGVVSWLDNLGYEVTTLMAGLGVGGVAIAFAAQRSIENLIGSITIYSSQPVHVGDFCKFGDKIGTIEEIGLRATQLRTLERTVVHIPNAKFSSEMIENLTQRDKILYRCRLRLSYETTPMQVRKVLEKIREMISSTDYIDADASRVRFLEMGKYAQELELYVYINTQDFTEYLEKREDVNLKVIDIIAESGAQLTLPASRTLMEGRGFAADIDVDS